MAGQKLRTLKLSSFDELRSNVTELLDHGYSAGGNWNLAQVCRHLDDFMRFPMDGFPKSPFPISMILTLIRITSGPRILRRMLESHDMPSGKPTIPSTVYQSSQSEDGDAVAAFLKTIDRMDAFNGTPVPSPVFGPMDAATAKKLQLLHCSHHLSFLKPA